MTRKIVKRSTFFSILDLWPLVHWPRPSEVLCLIFASDDNLFTPYTKNHSLKRLARLRSNPSLKFHLLHQHTQRTVAMSVLSRIKPIRPQSLLKSPTPVRHGGHGNVMQIYPSNLSWFQAKDSIHMYFVTPAIIFAMWTWYKNIYEGEAMLADTPPGYRPHYFEYEKNPVTRFFVRNIYRDPAKAHERFMCALNYKQEVNILNKIQYQVLGLMRVKKDTFSYFQRHHTARYSRVARSFHILLGEAEGVHPNVLGNDVD